MQVRQLILTASAFVMAGAGPAHAPDPAPVAGASGLRSLVAEALARSPTVAQRPAAVRAATLRIRPAGSLPDPMLTVGVMDLVLPHFEFNQSDFTEADVELSQEIPWPGSLGARSGVMRAAAAGARAEERTVRRDLTTTMAVADYRRGDAHDSGRAAGSASRLYTLGALWVQARLVRLQVSGLLLCLRGRAPPDLGVAQTEPARGCRPRRFDWGRGWAARRGAPAQS